MGRIVNGKVMLVASIVWLLGCGRTGEGGKPNLAEVDRSLATMAVKITLMELSRLGCVEFQDAACAAGGRCDSLLKAAINGSEVPLGPGSGRLWLPLVTARMRRQLADAARCGVPPCRNGSMSHCPDTFLECGLHGWKVVMERVRIQDDSAWVSVEAIVPKTNRMDEIASKLFDSRRPIALVTLVRRERGWLLDGKSGYR